jgi:hypothetical protein
MKVDFTHLKEQVEALMMMITNLSFKEIIREKNNNNAFSSRDPQHGAKPII